MQNDGEWALLREYASGVEATLDLGTLETTGIPTLVRGLEPGIWGPGFTGNTVHGVRVFVPATDIEYARELIGVEPVEPEPTWGE